MTATQAFIEALHDKLQDLHGDLDGFAHAIGCEDKEDTAFGEMATESELVAAGLTEEEASYLATYIEEHDHACLKYLAHAIYWEAQD